MLLTAAAPAYIPAVYSALQGLDLQFPPGPNDFFNARNALEEYLVSGNGSNPAGGGYYVLMPNGNLYAWTNNSLASTLASTPVAMQPVAFYQNPSFLFNPAPPGVLQVTAQSSTSVTTTAISAAIVGTTLTVTDTAGYLGTVLIFVTSSDGALTTTATFQVTFN